MTVVSEIRRQVADALTANMPDAFVHRSLVRALKRNEYPAIAVQTVRADYDNALSSETGLVSTRTVSLTMQVHCIDRVQLDADLDHDDDEAVDRLVADVESVLRVALPGLYGGRTKHEFERVEFGDLTDNDPILYGATIVLRLKYKTSANNPDEVLK